MRRRAPCAAVNRLRKVGIMERADDGMQALGPKRRDVAIGNGIADEREREEEVANEITQDRCFARVEVLVESA